MKSKEEPRPEKEGDICPSCGGIIRFINAVEPWHPDQLQCEKCDGTWCLTRKEEE